MRLRPPPDIATNPALSEFLRDIYKTMNFSIHCSPGFFRVNAAAGLNGSMDMLGTAPASIVDFVVPLAGRVAGISIRSNEARTAGSLTVNPVIDGTVNTRISAVLDATNTQSHSMLSFEDTGSFNANSRLGVNITTTGAWDPVTADVVAVLYYHF